MTSRGHAETEQLRLNLEGQLERLVQQLSDLESCRSELDDCEYNETKKDTMEQLHELNESLSKMVSGDMTLIDEFSAMQLKATQAAISAAFRTPAVIRMFARREPVLLRQRLSDIERDIKLGKNIYNEKMEVLNALRQLGEKLSVTELRALEEYSSVSLSDAAGFVQVSDRGVTGQEALDMASREAESVEGRN